MAIEIEEETKPKNWAAIITAVAIVAALFIGAYYLFFKKPELIEIVIPSRLQDLGQLSRAQLDPKAVIDSAVFKTLRDFSTKITLPQAGRDDPFKPF